MGRNCLFLPFLLLWTCIQAQQYPFVHYTPREGLANNRAKFVFQDSRGKLYISTFGGLSVYDGSHFTNYNSNNGLVANLVNDIVEMGKDSIWILLNANKIHCLVNGRLKVFETTDNFVPVINQLVKGSDGMYYAIADEGLFSLSGRKFQKITANEENLRTPPTDLSQAIEIGNKLFILSNPDYRSPYARNLLVYDLEHNKWIASREGIEATFLFRASEDELWVATTRGIFRAGRHSITGASVNLLPLPDSLHIRPDLNCHFIYKDRQQNTWLATAQGVYRVDKKGETVKFTVENGLTTNLQTRIFQDRENNMWFVNEQTGLSKLTNQRFKFYPQFEPGFSATDIFNNAGTDSVWLYDGYDGKVILMVGGKKSHQYSIGNRGADEFISVGNKYLLAGNKIYRWEMSSSRHSLFYSDTSGEFSFHSGLVDRKGNLIALTDKLWVFTSSGVLNTPLEYFSDHITIDRKNRIWVATRSNQLFCYEITGSGHSARLTLLQSYSKELLPGSPRSVTSDSAGHIWIGTRDHGLYCIFFDDLKIKAIRHLTTADGLSENFVNFLYTDKENSIWACTPAGLDQVKYTQNGYSIASITRSNNLYYPVAKIQQSRDGIYWILSRSGLIIYEPSIHQPGLKPELIFTDVIIGNAKQKILLPGDVLGHQQNNLFFELSAPTYIDEAKTRFSYILEGSGVQEWSDPSSNSTINLVNLTPGKYNLRAKAIFLHGIYPDAESSFAFTILPPWWQTILFKLTAGLILLTMSFFAIRYYFNRKLALQRALLEKKQAVEKERTRIATDMHDDLGAGLSRIRFLSETIGMKKQKQLPIDEEIDTIRTYSHDMIDKMGEIVWALNEKNDTLNDLLSYTRAYAAEYLLQNGIDCLFKEPEDIPALEVSGEFRRNIYLTVKEALHNVVKHAGATGVKILVDISDKLIIQIWDNGKGLNEEKMRSYGNGLRNMRLRMAELRGKLEIKNQNGTLVFIQVPLDR